MGKNPHTLTGPFKGEPGTLHQGNADLSAFPCGTRKCRQNRPP